MIDTMGIFVEFPIMKVCDAIGVVWLYPLKPAQRMIPLSSMVMLSENVCELLVGVDPSVVQRISGALSNWGRMSITVSLTMCVDVLKKALLLALFSFEDASPSEITLFPFVLEMSSWLLESSAEMSL